VVFADPDFGEPSEGPSSGNATSSARTSGNPAPGGETAPGYFPRLVGTIGESKRVLAMLPHATLQSGANATESAVKSVRAPRILHIATHGFFLQDESAATDNPLLRSGLALAGANRSRKGSEDGILTALEAANLDLWGTKLVTLSACDTAIGVISNGEGVFGMRRAFFLAGAESLVMSLWPVSDLITSDLMAGYYSGLNQGLGRGASLRRLQLQMLRRSGRSHPFYWASFIHAGEWASLDGNR
jgi:CHAT domain-containing protein